MNICIPYTYFVNDLFRCLFRDLELPFTPAPVPGKYTEQIGAGYATGSLCKGLEKSLGSIVECSFLGADTALLFAPCGECTAQRIRMKVQNCLEENGVEMQVLCLEPGAVYQKDFWSLLGANSAVSRSKKREVKRLFADCCALSDAFFALAGRVQSDKTGALYLQKALGQLQQAQKLMDLKLLLLLYNKRLQTIAGLPLPSGSGQKLLPYEREDYFCLKQPSSGALQSFFRQEKQQRKQLQREWQVPRCAYCL